MSQGLLAGAAGAGIGFLIGGPTGAMYGYALGSLAGSILFGPKIPTQHGPRLTDLSIQSSAEGQPIFKIYGTMRTAGNVFWGKPITEHKHKKKSGGKGGGGQKSVTYSYTADFAIGMCEGPISAVVKLWADGKLIYDVSVLTAAEQAIVDGGGYLPSVVERFQSSFSKTTNIVDTSGTMRIYPGSETQLPDPLIEADLGVGNTPAYRGTAYIVFDNFELADFGNRIPNITAQVIADGAASIQYIGKVAIPETERPSTITDTAYKTLVNYIAGDRVIALGLWTNTGSGILPPFNSAPIAPNFKATPITIYPSGLTVFGTDMLPDPANMPGNDGGIPVGYLDDPGVAMHWNNQDSSQTFWRYSTLTGNPLTIELVNTFNSADNSWAYGTEPYFQRGGVAWAWQRDSNVLYRQTIGRILSGTEIAPLEERYNFTTDLAGRTEWYVFVGSDQFVMLVNDTPYDRLLIYDVDSMTQVADVPVPYAASSRYKGKLYIDAAGTIYVLTSLYPHTNVSLYSYVDGAWDNLGTLTGAGTYTRYFETSNNSSDTWAVVGGMVIMHIANDIHYWALGAVSDTSIPLSTIVADICDQVDLDSSFVDVTDLASTYVNGYIRNAQMTARAAIEPLASGFLFDAVESADKILFKLRGGASVASIAYDDLGAAEPGSQQDRIVTTINQDNELPIELNMKYVDPARDFQIGSQRSRRQVPQSQKIDTIEMPISWTSTEAKQAVEKLHYTAWEEHTQYAFSLPLTYLRLEPTDIVTLPVNGVTRRVRVTKTSLGSVINCEAVSDYAANYTSESIAAVSPIGPQTISVPGTTIMQLLDIPLLQDADNNAGLYIAAMGTGSGWTGTAIYKSTDGVVFDYVDVVTVDSVMGSTTTALPTGVTTIWDDGSTVKVKLIGGALTSVTDLEAMAGSNTAAIGAHGRWELVSFATATLNGDGTYTLSRLIRGRKGSEWAVGTHVAGDAFVLLEAGALIRNVPATTDIGSVRYYKAISFGGDEGDVITYTHQAVGLECYAPVHIRGRRHSPSTNDWAITWVRRGRIDGAWRDYVDVPLGQATESYEIDIMSGATVKRTLTSATQSVTYTSAQQTTDWGAAQTTITVKIYQMSATVGRGYAGTQTL